MCRGYNPIAQICVTVYMKNEKIIRHSYRLGNYFCINFLISLSSYYLFLQTLLQDYLLTADTHEREAITRAAIFPFLNSSGVPVVGVLGVQHPPPPPPIFQSFDIAEPNPLFRGKYIRNNLIRIRVSLILKLSGTSD
jgi:hypothetical protein